MEVTTQIVPPEITYLLTATTQKPMNDIKIAHLNISSSGPDLMKPQTLINSLHRKFTDIICITEAKITKKNKFFFKHTGYSPPHINKPSSESAKEGVVTLISNRLNNNVTKHETLIEGKATKIQLNINNQNFNILCIYAPSQGDNVSKPFYEKILVDEHFENNHHNIIIGDFNVIQTQQLDRHPNPKSYYKKNTAKTINNFKLDYAMVDPWRTTHPEKQTFSWQNRTHASRIDYALISASTYHLVQNTEYFEPPVQTDHKGFSIHLNLKKYTRGRGYFKIKNEMYSDPNFVTQINEMIDTTIATSNPNTNPEITLDTILFNATTIARNHLENTNREKSEEENYLITEIKSTTA